MHPTDFDPSLPELLGDEDQHPATGAFRLVFIPDGVGQLVNVEVGEVGQVRLLSHRHARRVEHVEGLLQETQVPSQLMLQAVTLADRDDLSPRISDGVLKEGHLALCLGFISLEQRLRVPLQDSDSEV